MTVVVEQIEVKSEGWTLSRLIWSRFYRPMPGLVEVVLAANPGLGALGPFLPVGTVVSVPVPATSTEEPVVTPVRLWG